MEDLTKRERECVELFGQGLTAREIAEQLYLSVRTVESHLLNACKKYGCHNTRRLVHLVRALTATKE